MRCPKCKVIAMHDDPDRQAGIQVYACFTCGNRVYVGYPKRRGEEKELHYSPEGIKTAIPARGENTVVVPFPRAPKKKAVTTQDA
jgi:hypothetical protein